MRDSEEFKFVTRRKKRISHVRNIRHTSTFLTTNDIDDGSLNINYETLTGKLLEAETEVTSKMKPNTKLLHSLVQEIRRSSSEQKSKNNIMIQYILEQARSHRETSEVLCKAREELKNLAETYLCYLNSQRVCKEIQIRYTGKGERSIKETADLVGFKLPHDPK
ncbi:protein FMC1 homolog isoform X2 [Frieseomelitta varia]|uniref:protein FMC1 homolog isoform X2 n=1 Tax=Frieseomelitta varia TaxID=561572 RepID=UPI001CB6884E|nr:protein FMC1 homolog isoform X2 [Frieseomelitta varia]